MKSLNVITIINKLKRMKSVPLYDSESILKYFKRKLRWCTESVELLTDGYTNVTMLLTLRDGKKLKLSAYSRHKSYLSDFQTTMFIVRRRELNRLFKDNFKILYSSSRLVLSEYIEGSNLAKVLKSVNRSDSFQIIFLNSLVIDCIDKFHHNVSSDLMSSEFPNGRQDLFDFFSRSLFGDYQNYYDFQSLEIIEKLDFIKRFESKFDSSRFVPSHLDTDPVNFIYDYHQVRSSVSLIDFEYAGTGLDYYDYANYFSVITRSLNLSGGRLSLIKGEFIDKLSKIIPSFDVTEFDISVKIMEFTWGLWYLLYGFYSGSKELQDIGIDSIKNFNLEEMLTYENQINE